MNKNITRSMLTDSLIFGKKIDLYYYNPMIKMWCRFDEARVTALSLESGSAEGTAARHFIVTFTTYGGVSLTTYVNTID